MRQSALSQALGSALAPWCGDWASPWVGNFRGHGVRTEGGTVDSPTPAGIDKETKEEWNLMVAGMQHCECQLTLNLKEDEEDSNDEEEQNYVGGRGELWNEMKEIIWNEKALF